MWANENAQSKTKFSIAAKVYTLERDHNVWAGLPKVSLKEWLYANCGRFQINSPEFHVIPHLIYTMEEEGIIGYRQWIMDGDMFLRNTYPLWPTAPTAIEILAQRDYDTVVHGEELVLSDYYSNPHFQQFDFQLALAFAHLQHILLNNAAPVNNPVVANVPVANAAPVNNPAVNVNNAVTVNNPATNNAVATNP